MDRIIIYTAGLLGKTGIYTWIRNFCINMRNEFDITILCNTFDDSILLDLSCYAVCDIYVREKQYECDIYLHNYQDNNILPFHSTLFKTIWYISIPYIQNDRTSQKTLIFKHFSQFNLRISVRFSYIFNNFHYLLLHTSHCPVPFPICFA